MYLEIQSETYDICYKARVRCIEELFSTWKISKFHVCKFLNSWFLTFHEVYHPSYKKNKSLNILNFSSKMHSTILQTYFSLFSSNFPPIFASKSKFKVSRKLFLPSQDSLGFVCLACVRVYLPPEKLLGETHRNSFIYRIFRPIFDKIFCRVENRRNDLFYVVESWIFCLQFF